MRTFFIGVAILVGAVAAANAADPNLILGRWIEKFPNGTGMVTEFTARSLESYTVDATGQRAKDVGKFAVSYRSLDASTVGVDFQGSAGGVLVLVKDHDTIVLDFPGTGAHTLKRLGDQVSH
jgi:hypothetical protein